MSVSVVHTNSEGAERHLEQSIAGVVLSSRFGERSENRKCWTEGQKKTETRAIASDDPARRTEVPRLSLTPVSNITTITLMMSWPYGSHPGAY